MQLIRPLQGKRSTYLIKLLFLNSSARRQSCFCCSSCRLLPHDRISKYIYSVSEFICRLWTCIIHNLLIKDESGFANVSHLTRALTVERTTLESRKRGVTRMWKRDREAKATAGDRSASSEMWTWTTNVCRMRGRTEWPEVSLHNEDLRSLNLWDSNFLIGWQSLVACSKTNHWLAVSIKLSSVLVLLSLVSVWLF